jgi:hypothetical protein
VLRPVLTLAFANRHRTVRAAVSSAHPKIARRWAAIIAVAAAATLQPASARAQMLAVRTVPFVDLDRYAGEWFEIARFENRFQRQCVGDVRASYARRADGRIDVVNRCRTGGRSDRSTRRRTPRRRADARQAEGAVRSRRGSRGCRPSGATTGLSAWRRTIRGPSSATPAASTSGSSLARHVLMPNRWRRRARPRKTTASMSGVLCRRRRSRPTMKVVVNDQMQKGYVYYRTEPVGRNFASGAHAEADACAGVFGPTRCDPSLAASPELVRSPGPSPTRTEPSP